LGFISCTPAASSSSPLSTLRNGTTPRSARRAGTGLPPLAPSIVFSNRIAPMTLPLPKQGLSMMRWRIWWISANISSSLSQPSSSMP
jgi:hypothetical protein